MITFEVMLAHMFTQMLIVVVQDALLLVFVLIVFDVGISESSVVVRCEVNLLSWIILPHRQTIIACDRIFSLCQTLLFFLHTHLLPYSFKLGVGMVPRSEACQLSMQGAPSSIPTSGTFFRGHEKILRPFSLFR